MYNVVYDLILIWLCMRLIWFYYDAITIHNDCIRFYKKHVLILLICYYDFSTNVLLLDYDLNTLLLGFYYDLILILINCYRDCIMMSFWLYSDVTRIVTWFCYDVSHISFRTTTMLRWLYLYFTLTIHYGFITIAIILYIDLNMILQTTLYKLLLLFVKWF